MLIILCAIIDIEPPTTFQNTDVLQQFFLRQKGQLKPRNTKPIDKPTFAASFLLFFLITSNHEQAHFITPMLQQIIVRWQRTVT